MVLMRIIKRVKGKRAYYYLQHSFRLDGKTVTREKYIGRSVPKDVSALAAELSQEQDAALSQKLDRICEHFQKEWRSLPPSARARELEEVAIAFTYNTNAIEGSTITLPETRSIIADKVAPIKPLADVKETEAHAHVFLRMLGRQEPVTKAHLLEWHQAIFGGTKPDIAGAYRRWHVRVGPYRAPDWQDAESLMAELLAFIRSAKLPAVELAARAHYRFEKVHPFGDGNGRIGRLLLNAMLWHAGYPMLIIERKGRASYYKALQGPEDRFLAYFLRRYLSVHRARLR